MKKSGVNIGYIAAVAAIYTTWHLFAKKHLQKEKKKIKILQSRKKDGASQLSNYIGSSINQKNLNKEMQIRGVTIKDVGKFSKCR